MIKTGREEGRKMAATTLQVGDRIEVPLSGSVQEIHVLSVTTVGDFDRVAFLVVGEPYRRRYILLREVEPGWFIQKPGDRAIGLQEA